MENRIESHIENIEEADSIIFSADITNEEALIFQFLKEKRAKRLICAEGKAYQDFLNAYSSVSGLHMFKGDLETLAHSDLVISFGVWFQDQSTASAGEIRKTIEERKPRFVYMHPIEDAALQPSVSQFIKYEAGSEEGVAGLLAVTLLEDKTLPENIEEILEEFDIGYLSAESNVGEEELESMYRSVDETTTLSVIIGSDLYTHPKAGQIAKLLALLERYAGVNVVCLPPAQNALGVALVCDLDEKIQGKSTVYHTCKEGTYVHTDKCVYISDGRDPADIDALNHMAKMVGLDMQTLMDYSRRLPETKGFQAIDEVKKGCLYPLALQERDIDIMLDEIEEMPLYDGALVYTYKVEEPIMEKQRMPNTLYGSKQFATATKLQDGDMISFEVGGVKFSSVFKIDTHMKGVIALNPVVDIKLSAYLLSSYRFSRLAFEKIHNQKIGNNDE